MARNTISRITSRIDELTKRRTSKLITLVAGADEAECHKRLDEIKAAGGVRAGCKVYCIITGVPRAEYAR
jgi:hypothetical protein